MYLQIKKLFIVLLILCFWVGCTQVKHIVTDVKEAVTGPKEDTQKATTEEKETKKTTSPSKKGTRKTTTQPPAGDVFGPK
jgi:Sec-independent protein translocase protein TatA